MSATVVISQMCVDARTASHEIATASLASRNSAIEAIVDSLDKQKNLVFEANALDMQEAEDSGLAQPLQDRLKIDERGFSRMLEAAQAVAALPDPIGAVDGLSEQPSGIVVGKMRVPLGTIGMIYESRPNVTLEAATLCIKSGNACILRGGSESIHSNIAIATCVEEGLANAALSPKIVQVLKFTDRAAVSELLRQEENIDLIVPRGGKGLIERVSNESNIPVLKHLDGICHVYIDESADVDMAVEVALNSKTSKYAVCNAMETLLIHQSTADYVLPRLVDQLQLEGVEIRGCAKSQAICNSIGHATEDDWREEYLAPVLAVRVVENFESAVAHIRQFGSEHTDAIITQNHERAQRFLKEVDSATVMVNTSTQFADGFEFGLGAEIGISTDRLHARGPVGLAGLTTQKYIVYGHGEVRNR